MKTPVSICVLAAVCVAVGFQGGRRGRGGPKPNPYPFFQISKVAGFDVARADKTYFIEMGALGVQVGPETVPKFKKPKWVVQLEYGYKKGGNVMIYETEKVPGVSAKDVFDPIINGRILRDHQYEKEWSILPVEDKTRLIMISGTTAKVRDLMIKTLKH